MSWRKYHFSMGAKIKFMEYIKVKKKSYGSSCPIHINVGPPLVMSLI